MNEKSRKVSKRLGYPFVYLFSSHGYDVYGDAGDPVSTGVEPGYNLCGTNNNTWGVTNPHSGLINIALADGHAESVKPGKWGDYLVQCDSTLDKTKMFYVDYVACKMKNTF